MTFHRTPFILFPSLFILISFFFPPPPPKKKCIDCEASMFKSDLRGALGAFTGAIVRGIVLWVTMIPFIAVPVYTLTLRAARAMAK